MAADRLKAVLFLRRLRGLTGGHLKVWDYFRHTLAAPGHTARIVFTPDSVWNESNPWRSARQYVVSSRDDVTPDLLFLAGLDWEFLTPAERANPAVPVVNLIQGLRHGDPADPRHAFLRHCAIRVCVGPEIADAIRARGAPNGPVVVIPNAVSVEDVPPAATRDIDLLVAGLKQPDLGARIAKRLSKAGRCVELLTARLPRDQYLARVARSRTAVFLPLASEGFYLPALEAMALGTLVVCPDAVGNRSFCTPDVNCLRPTHSEDEIVAAAELALALPAAARDAMLVEARETAARHGLAEERRAYHDLLRRVGALWGG